MPPKLANRYRIEGELGRGGLGAVYRARELSNGRIVALKTLSRVTERTTALFEREYHVLASMKHPSVIEVYDFGVSDDGQRYYTMEVLPGADIVDVAPIPWREACRHMRDIAASLGLLHGRRLLHRDVSPRNIRFDAQGRAKLIDFGAVTTFGVASEIVGTPMCVAPEVIRQVELDQRSDLFSLGVVFYFALTGRKPFVVKALKDVEAAVAVRPPPPSDFAADVPKALDQLILSMLSADRIGRPTTAAEIMERVGAIAELDDEPTPGVAESHLVSTSLCGRERETAQLSLHVKNAVLGQGGVVVIEATSRMGKSRLVSELLISARLAGVTTLRVDALAHPEPLGVIRALGALMLEKSPAEATETLAPHLAVLWQALPEARRHMRAPSRPPAALPDDVNERRARIQHHFVRWTLDIAARKPLLIAIDDSHATDTTSAGVLSEIAHVARNSRILLVTTELLGAESPVAIQQLTRLGARIKLRGISLEAVEQLVASAFGDVPNCARLSQWLFEVGLGNPGQSLALLSHLMSIGVIRYSEGAWVLPSELADSDLPANIEEALRVRVAKLSPGALKLARLLAVHRGPLSPSAHTQTFAGLDSATLSSAIDELSAHEMIAAAGVQYRLADETLRTVLLRGVPHEEILELHLLLGRALDSEQQLLTEALLKAATPTELVTALHAGYHLSQGGDEVRGPMILRQAGIELAHRGEGLGAAIPALETAIASQAELKRSPYQRGLLMIPLVLAGAYVDFRLAYRYGEDLMAMLADTTGMTLASRLRRFVGPKLALLLGLLFGVVRYPFMAGGYRSRGFMEVILGLITMSPATIGVAVPLLDRALGRRILLRIAPLEALSMRAAPRLVYEFCLALCESAEGEFAAARDRGKRVFAQLQKPSRTLPEDARLQLSMGVLILVGALDTYRTDGAVHETLEILDGSGTSSSQQTAAGVRASYHANRGERELFEQHQREVDALAARAGSTWRSDVLIARNLWWPHALCEDVMGLKHCVRQLESLVKDAPSLALMHDAAHASYLAARGMHLEALQRYGKTLEAGSAEPNELSMRVIGTLARIWRLNHRAEKSEALCRTSLAALRPAQLEFEVAVHGVRLEHAYALWDIGQHEECLALLDRVLDDQDSHDNPLLHGLTHKARAQMALAQGDRAVFRAQLDAMDEWFRRTENPSLIAQCHALADEGSRAGLLNETRQYAYSNRPSAADTETKIRAAFGRCRGSSDRLQTALDMVLAATGAERGYLYLVEAGGGLRFAAPLVGHEPPEDLKRELSEKLDSFCNENDETAILNAAKPEGMHTVIGSDELPSIPPMSLAKKFSSVFLVIPKDGQLVAVGAVALLPGDESLLGIPTQTLEEIARGIYDAADVHTVFFGPTPPVSSSARMKEPRAHAGPPQKRLGLPASSQRRR
jgi:tRNA A-37 threonylcarbamoyl transferase component Bud32/tetratricopeptide (TPR) repeat protein